MKRKKTKAAVLAALALLACSAARAGLAPVAEADFNLPGVVACRAGTPQTDDSPAAQGSQTRLYALPEPLLPALVASVLAIASRRRH